MAWRDSRASRRRLVLFSLSIVLGIAALVAIGSFNANLQRAIDGQARTLLGADLEVTSRAALGDEAETFLASLGGVQAREQSMAAMVVFPSRENATRLITLRAMDGAYPFYGDFVTVPAGAPARIAAGEAVAILEETLMAQFGIAAGDEIKLGDQTFVVAGSLLKIPGDNAAVAMLSPRVIIAESQLPATGLVGPQSLVRYKRFFKFDEGRDVEAMVEEMRGRFRELRLGFDTVEERKQELGQVLENVYSFLGLVGFIALFLGAIGVASAIHVYVRQKLGTVAVLRCLGASAGQAFAVYLVQGVALGIFGAGLGAAIGVAVQLSLSSVVGGLLPFEVEFFVSGAAVARGVAAGLVICVLFTLLPLLAVRRVPPLAAIRAVSAEPESGGDPWRWAVYGAIVVAVTGFAVTQSPRWEVGVGFVGALAVGFAVLAGLAKGIAWAARRVVPAGAPYVVRQGVANLHRPNNRTVLLLLALGLGTFLIVTLTLTRATLLAQIAGSGGEGRPNLLFFDIQDDQIAELEGILAREEAPLEASAPIVTMKVMSLKGRSVAEVLGDPDNAVPGWTLRREYRSTFRGELGASEKLLEGEFTGEVAADVDVVPISLERDLAKDMGLGLGDEIEWDVQGLPLRTRVTSLREVEWRRMEPNFFVVFPRGVLEAAPKFFVAATKVDSPADSARVQQAVVSALPNVSAIDLQLIIETLDSVFSRVQFVIQFMAAFTVITGIIVLAGAILSGRFQRLREAVLLRTLGATARQLWQIQLVEYAILGVLAAVVGCGLAVGANLALAYFVFDTVGVWAVGTLAWAVLAVTTVTLVTGLLASRGVANHPPLEVLRQETA
jgi:putative ABC transport system permease protein